MYYVRIFKIDFSTCTCPAKILQKQTEQNNQGLKEHDFDIGRTACFHMSISVYL